MSNAEDDKIAKERKQTVRTTLLYATQLELRAHQLILEAHELRKLAKRLGEIQTPADTLCGAVERNQESTS